MIKCFIIRKDGVIPCNETIVIMTVFCGHILYMSCHNGLGATAVTLITRNASS